MKEDQNMIAAINYQRVIWIKFHDHSLLFITCRKNWPLSRGYFGSWGHILVAIAIVERLNKSHCMNCPQGQSTEVDASGGSTVLLQ